MTWFRAGLVLLILIRAVYGIRFFVAGLMGRLGEHGALGTSEVVTRSLAADPVLSHLIAALYLAAYLALAILVWRSHKLMLPVAIFAFMADQGRWVWATTRVEDTLVHAQLAADTAFGLDIVDWLKFAIKCLILGGVLVMSRDRLGGRMLAGPRSD